jgi:hypothetical protein
LISSKFTAPKSGSCPSMCTPMTLRTQKRFVRQNRAHSALRPCSHILQPPPFYIVARHTGDDRCLSAVAGPLHLHPIRNRNKQSRKWHPVGGRRGVQGRRRGGLWRTPASPHLHHSPVTVLMADSQLYAQSCFVGQQPMRDAAERGADVPRRIL